MWEITKHSVTILPNCNQKEADTRLIYHAAQYKETSVIVSKDTDVFLLSLYAYGRITYPASWYLKIDKKQFIDVCKIYDNLGSDACDILPQLHAITGCDTTAYKFNVGKIRVLKKVNKVPSCLHLIKDLGDNTHLPQNVIEDAKTFVQSVVYNGKKDENYVSTRIPLYKNLKKKSSMIIIRLYQQIQIR